MEEEARRVEKPEGWRRIPRKEGALDTTRQRAQGLHGSVPDGVLDLKEVDICPHP